jgi:CDP-diacylglycerol--glycerol-3-phosphate 3-phosphatidyltransferase
MSDLKRKDVLNVANAVTSLRLFGAIAMIFIAPLSAAFYAVYTICGLSDGIDGTIARKMGTSSEFGARLDSVSDILFYAVMFVKLMPVLIAEMPGWIWYIVGTVLAIRIAAYGIAFLRYNRMAAIHTYMNKVTGALVFLVPYYLLLPFGVTLCAVTAGVAAVASLEELLIHLTNKKYQAERKSLFAEKVK